MNIDNQKDSPNNDLTFHGEVEERLKWWSEKHNKTMEEAHRQRTQPNLSATSLEWTAR